MQFTTLALFAAAAVATPLQSRWDWGTCKSECQYTCTTNGILNVLTCASVLDGNVITIPITAALVKREEAVQGMQKRNGDETCCTTDGIANVLTCVDLVDGNKITVPISVILGWL